MEDSQLLARNLPGITSFNIDGVRDEDADRDRRWERTVRRISSTPGVIVVEAGKRNERYAIAGLRDPFAPDPDAILAANGFDETDVTSRWEPYEADAPDLVLARAARLLSAPQKATLNFRNGILYVSGEATHQWIVETKLLARTLRGVTGVNMDGLVDSDIRELEIIRGTVDKLVFRVFPDTGSLVPGQEKRLAALGQDIRQLSRIACRVDRDFLIEMRGHVPATGTDGDTGESASLSLTRRFLELLRFRNFDVSVFIARGMGSVPPPGQESEEVPKHEGRISFKVLPPSGSRRSSH